jgi:hypothetical protein
MEELHRGVREGQRVDSADGKRMGRVVNCGETAFAVEHGFFFPKDFLVPYDDVGEIRDDHVQLVKDEKQLKDEWRRTDVVGDAPDEAERVRERIAKSERDDTLEV